MNKRNHRNRRRPISREEAEAMMAFYGISNEKPHSMYDETFPLSARKPKITITQTIIEFHS